MSGSEWVGDVTYVTVACKGPKRFFDLDAVRTPYVHQDRIGKPINNGQGETYDDGVRSSWSNRQEFMVTDKGGAPPLDWHLDNPNWTPTPNKDAPMPIEYRIGDVFDRLAEIGDGTVDLIVTSPPFLALRSYLPADHPLKGKEIGSEATPAQFIDTLLALTAEFGRVLAPHGSLCVELGDTYASSGGVSDTSSSMSAALLKSTRSGTGPMKQRDGAGWPLAKSLTGIPTLYPWSLAYGRNLLTGVESPAGLWRIRNVIVWARPNPPVGALGDKFRPATSYITVACRGVRRFFDLDAVRTELRGNPMNTAEAVADGKDNNRWDNRHNTNAGAPPLDWQDDMPPEDGDWLWKLSTQPYKGAHYATFPLELPTRLIRAMCPQRVCVTCGKPSERITERTPEYAAFRAQVGDFNDRANGDGVSGSRVAVNGEMASGAQHVTTGWSECECIGRPCDCDGDADNGHRYSCAVRADKWRTGVVLDPFAGSGTTLQAAQNVGRHAIGIDLDETNADLARNRVGMFLEVVT